VYNFRVSLILDTAVVRPTGAGAAGADDDGTLFYDD